MKLALLPFFLRGVVAAAAIGLMAPACSSRPIAEGDGGGDAATAGTSGGAGRGGASGVAGAAGGAAGTSGSGRGGETAGSAGTGGGGGAAGASGGGGTAGSGPSGGRGGTGGGAAGGTGGGGASAGRGGAGGSAAGGTGGGGAGGRGGVGGSAAGGTGGASGGRGGASGGGGKAGAGGAPAAECARASDCKLFTDCCTCAAVPVGTTVTSCPAICIQSACDARQLPAGAVDCVAGRCVAGFACDSTNVTCRIAPPNCPAGEVPTVNDSGNCYLGTCAPASECISVAGCGACGASEACVTYQTQLGNQYHCVSIPPECNGAATCACLGPGSCVAPYRSCADFSGLRGVACSCPNC